MNADYGKWEVPFNRTIVELKHVDIQMSAKVEHSFNRTIVELKPGSLSDNQSDSRTFNRTIVELKLRPTARSSLSQTYPFNRTIVELKLLVFPLQCSNCVGYF